MTFTNESGHQSRMTPL